MRDGSLIPWWAIGAAIVVAMFAIPVSLYAKEDGFWYTDIPGYAPLVIKYRARDAGELSMLCTIPRDEKSGCAIRTPQVCYVYLGPRADACVESHEVNGHCKGKNHKLTYGIVQDCAYPS